MNWTETNDSGIFGIPAVAIPEIAQELYTINFHVVASSALLLWDILLTLDEEIQYIWKFEFSLTAVLFGIIRFLAVGTQIAVLIFSVGTFDVSYSFCKGLSWFRAMLGLIMFTCVDILLIFRLYALYGRNKVLLKSLCVLEAIGFVAVMCMFAVALPKFLTAPNTFPGQLRIGVCIPLGYPSIVPDIWIPILPIQAILLILAVGRYVYVRWKGPTLLSTTSHIYYTLIRDGVWTFFVLLVDILTCVIGNSLSLLLGSIAIYWCYAIIGICTSRLILNLRTACDYDNSLDASFISTKMDLAEGATDSYDNTSNSNKDALEDA